jgi:hypothetical protein
MSNIIKVNWWNEELDIYYRKMGYPKTIWKNNEGLPYGIYTYANREKDPFDCECEWFSTKEERDKKYLTLVQE